MPNNIHYYHRSYELKHQKEVLTDLSKEVDKFIRHTDKFVINSVAIEMNSVKINQMINDLLKAEKLIGIYINKVHRSSKIKIKHWERQLLQGRRDEIVGIRRSILRKLKKLTTRVRLMRNNVTIFKPTRQGVTIESVGQQIDNFVDFNKGEIVDVGGGLIIATTVLLAFLVELVHRKDRELE